MLSSGEGNNNASAISCNYCIKKCTYCATIFTSCLCCILCEVLFGQKAINNSIQLNDQLRALLIMLKMRLHDVQFQFAKLADDSSGF